MRISGPVALLTASLTLSACQTTPETPPEEQKAIVSVSERVDASLRDAAAGAEQRGDYQTALLHYRKAYERDDTRLDAIVGLSRSLRHIGRPKEAIAISERGLGVHKRHPELLAELGKAQLADNDALAAIDSLSRAGALEPEDWRINSALGIAYDRIGMYDQAERRYQLALKEDANNSVVLNNLALSKAQLGELPNAVQLLEKAVAQPDATPHIRQNLALLYAAQGRIDAAERLVRGDLDKKIADENMLYYRWLARNSQGEAVGVPLPSPGPSSSIVPPNGTRRAQGAISQPVVAPPQHRAVRQTEVEPPDATSPSAAVPPTPAPSRKIATSPPPPVKPKGEDASPVAASSSPPDTTETSAETATQAKVATDDRVTPPTEAKIADTDGSSRIPAPINLVARDEDQVDGLGAAPPSANLPPGGERASDSAGPTIRDEGQPLSSSSRTERQTRAASEETKTTVGKKQSPEKEAEATSGNDEAPARPRTASLKTKEEVRTTDGSVFRVQLGSYRKRNDANSGIQILQSKHADILESVELGIMAVTIPESGDFYRVMTAPIPSRLTASELCQKFKDRDVGCLVLRRQ